MTRPIDMSGPRLITMSRQGQKVSPRAAARLSQRSDFRLRSARAQGSAELVLRPLFRILLAAGLSEAQLIRVCETGIRRLARNAIFGRLGSMPHIERMEEVVARWIHHPAYSSHGEPILLPMKGKTISFSALVKSVAPRASPRTMLHALTQSHAVRMRGDGRIELVMRYSPLRSRGGVDIDLFTSVTTDFLHALEFNLLNQPRLGEGLFQRRAHKINSDARLAPVFNQYVREQSQLFLESIDEWLIRHQPKQIRGQRRRKVRLGVGVYVINEALR